MYKINILLIHLKLLYNKIYCPQYKYTKESFGLGSLTGKIGGLTGAGTSAAHVNKVIQRGLQQAQGIINPDIKYTPLYQGHRTEADIKNITTRMNDLYASKELAVKNKADLESLNANVEILETVEKLTPQNINDIATLTAQLNSLADLEQNIADVSSTNQTNTKMIHKLGKRIQQIGLKTAMPEGNPSPPPKGTGSSWPPPGGFAGR